MARFLRRSLRIGRSELDITIDATNGPDLTEAEKPVRDGKVLFSRTWRVGETSPPEDAGQGEPEEARPVDVVSRDPLRLRNVLLVPSAVVVLLIPFKAFLGFDDKGWYWVLLAVGLAGVLAWEGLRRLEKTT
jgi:hypothetical protein